MNYIIYGINRQAKDFLYVFNDLEVLCLTDDVADSNVREEKIIWGKYLVRNLADALAFFFCDRASCRIIICGIDKTAKIRRFEAAGLTYGKDYIFEEDFFPELDGNRKLSLCSTGKTDAEKTDCRKIAVWGTGNMCRFLMGKNLPWEVDAFIDSNKKADTCLGHPVLLPDEIADWRKYYVIIAVADDSEIRNSLCARGLREHADYTGYRELLALPSMLLRQTIFDCSHYDLNCSTMRNHLEILENGETRSCCTTFVARGLENIFDKDMQELWHSRLHRILCLSTENRTFSFCDKSMCPLFVGKKPEKDAVFPDESPYQEITPFPETVALGYDPSCNLSCITCRKGLHYAKGEELDVINKITDKVISEYLPHCRFLIMAGSGEVFVSPAYRKVYESEACAPQYIRLLSNGVLFTPGNWERFRQGKNARIMLTVSVDAATEETYGKIRRGGSFGQLRKNMEFASRLRRSGELCYFRMNFVVQRENYREMVPFVEWGQELGVDEIFFTKILNWGTYSPEEFLEISMMEQDGITPKPELEEVMKHPVMHSSIVDMGTIQFVHKIDETGTVENYYMWELEKRGGKIFC